MILTLPLEKVNKIVEFEIVFLLLFTIFVQHATNVLHKFVQHSCRLRRPLNPTILWTIRSFVLQRLYKSVIHPFFFSMLHNQITDGLSILRCSRLHPAAGPPHCIFLFRLWPFLRFSPRGFVLPGQNPRRQRCKPQNRWCLFGKTHRLWLRPAPPARKSAGSPAGRPRANRNHG